VGGRLFATFMGTLMNYYIHNMNIATSTHCLIAAIFYQELMVHTYFIDRSPTHFPLIMDYLRTGELYTKELKSREIKELEKEHDYYLLQIAAPLKSTEWHWDSSPTKKSANSSFSEDDLKITNTQGGASWNCPLIGSSPVSEFTVESISGHCIFIGFCGIDQFVQNGKHHDRVKNGCFFNCSNGDVRFNGGKTKSYSSKLKINDKITAITTGTSIRFLINGVDQGEAIYNAEGDMYPVVELGNLGDSVLAIAPVALVGGLSLVGNWQNTEPAENESKLIFDLIVTNDLREEISMGNAISTPDTEADDESKHIFDIIVTNDLREEISMDNAIITQDTEADDESKIMFNIIVTLKSLKLLTRLSKGAFGKVGLVELRKTGDKFALKYVVKKSCIEHKSTTNVFRELIILQDVCHPLTINVRFAFQGINNH
jgi:hypothetical protein